jgi:YidC/Oxa1 family membrane protein insertase
LTEPEDLSRRNEGVFDSRTFFAVMLSLAIWYGWLALFPPEPPPAEIPPEGEVAQAVAEAPPPAAASEAAVEVEDRDVPVELCGSKAVVNTRRGAVRSLELVGVTDRYHTQTLLDWALSLFSGPWKPYGDEPGPVRPLSPVAEALVVGVGPVGGACQGTCDVAPGVTVEESAPGRVVTVGRTADGVEIRRTLRDSGTEPCFVEVEVTWRNGGAAPVRGVWVGMHDVVEPTLGQYVVGFHPTAGFDGDVEEHSDLAEMPDDGAPLGTPVDWFGVSNTYFATVLTAGTEAEPGEGVVVLSQRSAGDARLAGSFYRVDEALAPGAERTERFKLFMGVKRLADLEAVDGRLTSLVQLGFFSFFAMPLLHLLGFLHSLVGDWALAIVALTFVVKTLFFRLSQQSYVSSQQMQAIQPELEQLRAEFKDNTEELNRRLAALFRDRGVNPAAGCLPILVQMPVWIALYSVLQTSVELYHAPFLYIRDLTAVDPYMVMPTVVVGLMVIQQRQMPTGNMDPAQAQIMRWMPLIFGVLFFSLPAGLLLYIFVNMVLSIAQQTYIKKTYKPQTQAPATPGG